ncbi:MAG: methyltransferase domain-containing protein [Rhodocyclaceae bacterium]|nr:methyltransferase domain-containing protein [Rhodocyclaceae bacterium]
MAEQQWNAEIYRRDGAFVARLGASLVDLLAVVPDERILDLGCGDGTLTATLRDRGARVLGLDASEAMVAAARGRGLEAVCCPADSMDFDATFDAVFSNAALHWMRDPDAVAARVFQALRPGGRFVAEFGGEGNVASVRGALADAYARRPELGPYPDPWYFPSMTGYRAVLERAGFALHSIERIERPTPLPSGVGDWLRLFADHALRELPVHMAGGIIAEVEEALAPRLRGADGIWTMDYVRLRLVATRPEARS